jgi:hypothetical protein
MVVPWQPGITIKLETTWTLIDLLVSPLATFGKDEHGKMKTEPKKMICVILLALLRAMQSLVNIKTMLRNRRISLAFEISTWLVLRQQAPAIS